MRGEISRLMVELAVSQGVREMQREIAKGDGRRALRRLVDHGRHFSRGKYPVSVFSAVQDMLRSPEHPYYALCGRIAAQTDPAFAAGFGVNLGYESLSAGARSLRAAQRQQARHISWFSTLSLDTGNAEDAAAALDACDPGVMTHLLTASALDAPLLRELCCRFSRRAFALLLPDAAVTDAALEALDGVSNLFIVPVLRDGVFSSAPLLRRRRRLYGLCRLLDARAIHRLLDSHDLRCPGDEDCPLPLFVPDDDLPAELIARLADLLNELRLRPVQPVFPVLLPNDLTLIDALISRESAPQRRLPLLLSAIAARRI